MSLERVYMGFGARLSNGSLRLAEIRQICMGTWAAGISMSCLETAELLGLLLFENQLWAAAARSSCEDEGCRAGVLARVYPRSALCRYVLATWSV